MTKIDAILIAGPTASGKSRLAVELALKHHGVVINANSMQVYRELRILSARPSVEDEVAVPHLLYGHVPAATRYSVGQWLVDAGRALMEARAMGRVPVFAGGTGLYFKALTEGLASIPPIPPDLRARILAEAEGVPAETLHARLAARDPDTAAGSEAERPRPHPSRHRGRRGHRQAPRPLATWRCDLAVGSWLHRAEKIVLDPPRQWLHQKIADRADRMVQSGSIEEALALARLHLSPDLPAMKAIGVRQFLDHDAGKLTLAEALASVKTETRRYAKRQVTWFRHQMADWERVPV